MTVAIDGTNLPLCFAFKGVLGGSVENQILDIVPEGIVPCVQKKAWADDKVLHIWYDKVYMPYIGAGESTSSLFLDDFINHKSDSLKQCLNSDNSLLHLIPAHYTGLLQPCDVSIDKSLKDQLKKSDATWTRNRLCELAPGEKIPAPNRIDVLDWLKKILD